MEPNQKPSKRLRRWHWEAMAVALAVVGVAMRLSSWSNVFVGQDVFMPDTDNYYHVWHALQLVEQFPSVPNWDPYISFPFGAPSPWPPGLDLLIGVPGFFGAGPTGIAVWGALLIPLLGGLGVYFCYRLGRRAFGPATGIVAAAFFALLPAAIAFARVGRVDHHGIVAPVVLGMFLAFLAALDAPSKRRVIGWGLVTGLLAGLSVCSWIITPSLYFLVIPATLLFLRFSKVYLRYRLAAWVSLGSSLVFVLLAVVWSADLGSRPFVLYQPSWLTVLIFLVYFGGVVSIYSSVRLFGAFALLLSGLLTVGFLTEPSWFAPLREALGVLAGQDPSYLMASESTPFLSTIETYTFHRAVHGYSYLIFLVPIVLLIYFWHWWRQRQNNPPWVMAGVFFGYASFLQIFQWRFGEYFAPAVALLLAWILSFSFRSFLVYWKTSAHKARLSVWAGLLSVTLGVALYPIGKYVWFSFSDAKQSEQIDIVNFRKDRATIGRQLERYTPSPVDKQGQLQYGMLSSWEDGHALLLISQRPVMISSFATPEALHANRLGFGLLLETDEDLAFRRMLDLRIRYVVLHDMVNQIDKMAQIAELHEDFIRVLPVRNENGYMFTFQPYALFAQSLYARLFLGCGTTDQLKNVALEPLSHFRLLLESSLESTVFDKPVPIRQVFEAVQGARIVGRATPDQEIMMRLSVEGNSGRSILYSRKTQTGSDGLFNFTVPYPTSGWNSPTRVVGPYRIKIGDRVVHLEVSEDDIQNGRTVEVPPN